MKEQVSYEQFIEAVEKEVNEIKKHATAKEIKNLDFNHLSPSNSRLCIYGQMTDSCWSKRAAELIFKCCERYVHQIGDINLNAYEDNLNFAMFQDRINGKKFIIAKKN